MNNDKMKAVILTNYGAPECLEQREIKKPEPKDNEVLIKIYATSTHIGDTRIRRAVPFLVRLMFGLLKPKNNLILGMEISGVVEAIGKDVRLFKKNDQVFALTGFGCGGYAEYRCLPEEVKNGTQESKGLVSLKPINLTHAEAATIPAGALTVLKNMQKANIQKCQKILIYGASGSLGTYAIQFAKNYGAIITAVCSANNFELVKSLGADDVIDYTVEDFTKCDKKFDIVYDAVMKLKPQQCRKVLKKTGVLLNNNGLPKIEAGDLEIIKELIESNKLRPVIDKVYPIDEIVEAHRYVEKGHKKGNVAITVMENMNY